MDRLRWTCGIFALVTFLLVGCSAETDDDDEDASESGSAAEQLYQISTISALSNGAYDGLITFDGLLEKGDFGLGTFDALDGELIVLDGAAYRVPASGIAEAVDGNITTPFAAVTTWETDARHTFNNPMNCVDLEAELDGLLDIDAAYAIKVHGQFDELTTRSEDRQEKPYAPLADVLKDQIKFELTNVDATMAGFRLPDYMSGSNAAGYHFHALTEDQQAGGHVLDCRTKSITVEIDAIDSWLVDLP